MEQSHEERLAALSREVEGLREAMDATRAWCEGLESRLARVLAVMAVQRLSRKV